MSEKSDINIPSGEADREALVVDATNRNQFMELVGRLDPKLGDASNATIIRQVLDLMRRPPKKRFSLGSFLKFWVQQKIQEIIGVLSYSRCTCGC